MEAQHEPSTESAFIQAGRRSGRLSLEAPIPLEVTHPRLSPNPEKNGHGACRPRRPASRSGLRACPAARPAPGQRLQTVVEHRLSGESRTGARPNPASPSAHPPFALPPCCAVPHGDRHLRRQDQGAGRAPGPASGPPPPLPPQQGGNQTPCAVRLIRPSSPLPVLRCRLAPRPAPRQAGAAACSSTGRAARAAAQSPRRTASWQWVDAAAAHVAIPLPFIAVAEGHRLQAGDHQEGSRQEVLFWRQPVGEFERGTRAAGVD